MRPENEPPVQQLQAHDARSHRGGQLERPGVVIEMNSLARARERHADPPLRCVASRHLADECSCRATVPAVVAARAWSDAQRSGGRDDGFFQFEWQDEIWLAFGLAGGEVRGVFCPVHRAEREALALQSA